MARETEILLAVHDLACKLTPSSKFSFRTNVFTEKSGERTVQLCLWQDNTTRADPTLFCQGEGRDIEAAAEKLVTTFIAAVEKLEAEATKAFESMQAAHTKRMGVLTEVKDIASKIGQQPTATE